MDRSVEGKISALMIQGRPFAPKDLVTYVSVYGSFARIIGLRGIYQVAPNIMIAAVAALPPAIVEAECSPLADGFATAM